MIDVLENEGDASLSTAGGKSPGLRMKEEAGPAYRLYGWSEIVKVDDLEVVPDVWREPY